MTPSDIGLISIVAIVLLIYAGMHVAVALGLASFVGVWLIRGTPEIATNLLAIAAADTLATYDFGVIPLFVLMGALVSAADLGRDTYVAANQLFRRVRGGLGIATVAANAVFAAVTGVSIASATVFTKIAVPEMLRLGYKPRFAVGVVAGSSVLGMLIPPSILLIVYGIVSEQSVGKLFLGGVVPGIVLAFMFSVMIYFMATRMPGFVGEPRQPDQSEMLSTLQITKLLGPIVVDRARHRWDLRRLVHADRSRRGRCARGVRDCDCEAQAHCVRILATARRNRHGDGNDLHHLRRGEHV